MPRLSLVIPLYNEERRVRSCLDNIKLLAEILGPLEVVLVDDGSTDSTLSIISATEHKVCSQPHRGKGAALRAGALASSGDRVIMSDADWSVPPQGVADLLRSQAPLVIATREHQASERIGEPHWRHIVGRVFNKVIRLSLPLPHQDTQCGCKILSRAAAQELFTCCKIDGWAYDVELLYLAHMYDYTVLEIPVKWSYEKDSRLKPSDSFHMLRELLRIRSNAKKGLY